MACQRPVMSTTWLCHWSATRFCDFGGNIHARGMTRRRQMTSAANDNQHAKSTTNLTELDDAELARRALTNDRDVWKEFVRRFEPVIRKELGRTLSAGTHLLCNDS